LPDPQTSDPQTEPKYFEVATRLYPGEHAQAFGVEIETPNA